ncbi:class I SAM-dependent methyltransferase [Lysinibacillus piscis]|uniref:Methyltransferase domain-containing protein n=1 Tax=Lysinibacillus piscis TaxID=2518931 RepID=A0ABQ5NIM2_9BACI|nr:class I SAM-dependent methyltransferase [Lysinibacillus sp. KH24]GLC87889.1 hypothetical protein LYSBPC_10160 [Lysinibacillus sp. KH24]
MDKWDINSNEYWNERFKKDWEELNGQKQTSFFINILIEHLPKWMNQDLNNANVCDAGCAEGQGTFLFKERYPNINIDGIDFSEEAVKKAQKLYPKINFFKDDIYDLSKTYDSIFISNVLEHFEDPFEIIRNLLEKTKNHLIIMVPFQEVERLKEHFYTFDYHNFPLKINNFIISYFKIVDCRMIENTLWDGKQAILIYTHKNLLSNKNTLDSFVNFAFDTEHTKKIDRQLYEQKRENLQLSDWGKKISDESIQKDIVIARLNQEIENISIFISEQRRSLEERDQLILEQNKKIEETSLWGQSLYEQVIERDRIIEGLNKQIGEISEYIQNNVKERKGR